MFIPSGHSTSKPLKGHAGMLDLFVSIVCKYSLKLRVRRKLDSLVVPIHCFNFFLQAEQRTVKVLGFVGKERRVFVIVRHRNFRVLVMVLIRLNALKLAAPARVIVDKLISSSVDRFCATRVRLANVAATDAVQEAFPSDSSGDLKPNSSQEGASAPR